MITNGEKIYDLKTTDLQFSFETIAVHPHSARCVENNCKKIKLKSSLQCLKTFTFYIYALQSLREVCGE